MSSKEREIAVKTINAYNKQKAGQSVSEEL